MKQNNYNKIVGEWLHSDPLNSDDYLAAYKISGTADNPMVNAYDTFDNEKFIISNIQWDGEILSFESLMPSTRRKGINKFRVVDENTIESEFCFSVFELMAKKTT